MGSASDRLPRKDRSDIQRMIADIVDGAGKLEIWGTFAWDEIQNRYRRSVFGLAWIGLSFILFVAAISIFFGAFAELDSGAFVSYVAIGFAAYQFLIANVVDGCHVFARAAGWVKSSNLPYSVYVYKGVSRALFPFFIHLFIALLILPFFGWRPNGNALFAIPALLLFTLTAVPLQFLLGLLAARWRDVGHLVQAISRIFFFTSPVLWVYAETTGIRRDLADFNPMTHFIAILRDPLLGVSPSAYHWGLSLSWLVCISIVAVLVGGAMRRRLPFWV
ncbi:ABC transporter permease [Parvularcula sp. ZS-1/3]|uniref:ABC transporter permease n=1 Tax=Parvularcula mediterranea TaxID=2732508 RepID=A0A7Y3W3U1_9PROT|nr:ABC transporter permease [Parvularcula mediterranea]NNU14798.1 ABC transporter permease [Parvularcula mediterranea]